MLVGPFSHQPSKLAILLAVKMQQEEWLYDYRSGIYAAQGLLCLLCATNGQIIGAIYGQRVSEEWYGQKKGYFSGHRRQINLNFMLSPHTDSRVMMMVVYYDIGYKKRESLVHRTATTSYPCYGQVLGGFGGSWSCTTFPTANIAIFSAPAKFLQFSIVIS